MEVKNRDQGQMEIRNLSQRYHRIIIEDYPDLQCSIKGPWESIF